MTKVTAIIPSWYARTGEYLKLCVESLRKTVDWDIIVVTNNSDVIPNLERIHGITIHLHCPQQGQCRAVNIGCKQAPPDADYFFVVNDDMYFSPGWNKHLKFDYPVFSPNLIEPIDNAGSAAPFLKLDGGLTIESHKPKVVDEFVASHNIEPDEDGFNLPFFVRKDVWETIGGYDEAYDPWGSNSDTDLQTLFELAGIKPKRERNVLVYHFGSKSGTFSSANQTLWWRNFNYYRDKFGYTRDDAPKANVWYCQNMIHWDKLKFHPKWEKKYADLP